MPPIVHEVLRSSGQPLNAETRAFMEPRFGHDFAAVRIHTDARATESAQAVNALAYTVGRDVVFGAGQYVPATSAGQRLMAHELTHVVQQTDRFDGPTASLQVGATTSHLEKEADHVADAIAKLPERSIGLGSGVWPSQLVQQTTARSLVQRFSTQDCASADVTRIEASHNRAIALLEAAISRLTADPVTAETQHHFANHFGGYGPLRRDIVVGHFRDDLRLLRASEMTYQCEETCDEGEPAYTYWIFGDIHICLPWLRSQVLTERGETFIHELHHWDPSRGHLDLGYHNNNEDNHTTWVVAVNNADAYSELAQDLYEQP